MKVVKRVFVFLVVFVLLWISGSNQVPFTARTAVSLQQGRWMINGKPTYPGAPAEGLLMNVRMVNAVFEDRKKPQIDPDEISDRFIRAIPNYVDQGVRAFTLNLQGGVPGYEGAVNSAFAADGSLMKPYMQRVQRVIEACDEQGAVVILGCFYQRQDQILSDEAAVKKAVVNVARWIKKRGFKNVLLEIANEYGIRGFDHSILKSDEGMASLIDLARQATPGLLISSSGLGDGRLSQQVIGHSDFLLIHFNVTKLVDIPERLLELKKTGKAIVCNEDQKLGEAAAQALRLCVENGASWGFMHLEKNQMQPFEFDGREDDALVYEQMKKLTRSY